MTQIRVGVFVLVGCLAVAGSALAQGSGSKAPAAGEMKKANLRVLNLDGRSISLTDAIKDKPAVLIFWASWCPSCREQTPEFQKAFDRFSKAGVHVVAVNIGVNETLASAKKHATENRLTLPVYFDADHSVTEAFRVTSTPTILLLDRSGKVVAKRREIDFDAIEALAAGKPIPTNESRPMPAGSGSTGK